MELLHRQVLALQTQRVLLGMWTGAFPGESSSLFQVLANHLPPLHRKAAKGFSLAAEPGLSSGHAVSAVADGAFASIAPLGGAGCEWSSGRTEMCVDVVVTRSSVASQGLLTSCARSINPRLVNGEIQLACPKSHKVIEKVHRKRLKVETSCLSCAGLGLEE